MSQPPLRLTHSRIRSLVLRIATSALIVSVLAAFLVAVATNHLPGGSTMTQPVKGGSIIHGLGFEPDTLVPMLPTEQSSVVVDGAIWSALWGLDAQGRFDPELAADVPSLTNGGISADLKTWTIHLRPGLKWSDGSPETAEDCAFSFNLYADPTFGNVYNFPTTDPSDPIGFVSARVVDSTTVTLTLKHAYPRMLNVLMGPDSTCLQKARNSLIDPADFAKPANTQPSVSNGPFKIGEWTRGDHLTVVRNPYYYRGPDKPYLDQVTFKVVGDANGIVPGLQSHVIDAFWGLDLSQIETYRALPGFTTYVDQDPTRDEMLAFNLSDPTMADKAVRQALTMSLDPNQVITEVMKGTAKPTCDDAGSSFAHEPDLVPCYAFDPTRAGQLLDADGWVTSADGYRHKDGKLLELSYVTTPASLRMQTQQLAQAAWKAIGIKVDLITLRGAEFFGLTGALCKGQFQIAEFNFGVGVDPDDHDLFASDQTCNTPGSSSNSHNSMHYANLEVDQAEQTQLNSPDLTVRTQAFHTIHLDVIKDLPVMYLWVGAEIACASSKLHDYSPSDIIGPTRNIEDWYLR